VEDVRIKGYRVHLRCLDPRGECRKLKHYIIALARRQPVIRSS
jgi:hypothetical protein